MRTVKWFNVTKGNGFIEPTEGDPDVFVHISAVQKAGYTDLIEGARISYELVPWPFLVTNKCQNVIQQGAS